MADYTNAVFAASYTTLDAAQADYDAVLEMYRDLDLSDYYDVALLNRDIEDGKVKVVKKHESATGREAWGGAAIGLAGGLLIAALPAVVLTGGLVIGTTAAGAVIGAITGHTTKGVTNDDLKDVGELLNAGEAGVLVVAGVDIEKRLELAIKNADQVIRKQLKVDQKELIAALRAAEKEANEAQKEADKS